MTLDTTFAGIAALAAIAAAFAAWIVIPRRRLFAVCDGLPVVEPRQGLTAPIEVRFGDQIVPQVTRTLVYIWNAGNKDILGSEISAGDPVRVQVDEGAKLLAANVIQTSQDGLGARTGGYTERERLFVFDRLPPKQGAIVEVYHTSSEPVLKVTGSVDGVARIRNKTSKGAYFDEVRKRRSTRRLVGAIAISFAAFVGAVIFLILSGPTVDWMSFLRMAPMVVTEIAFLTLLPGVVERFKLPSGLRAPIDSKKTMTASQPLLT